MAGKGLGAGEFHKEGMELVTFVVWGVTELSEGE
jgi:hypothetical protein